MNPWHGKPDGNQNGIVKLLEKKYGQRISIQNLAKVGDGCPDLLIGYRKRTFLFEMKKEANPKKRKLRPSQREWHAWWNGEPVYVVASMEEIEEIIGARVPVAVFDKEEARG